MEADLAPYPGVGTVLKVEGAEFSHSLVFENLDPFYTVSKQGPCLTDIDS